MCPWDNPVDAIDYVTTGVYNYIITQIARTQQS